jgi:hypothetical protein
MPLLKLHAEHIWFKDAAGRTVILRGINLGGDCKVPYTPDESTHIPTDFSSHKTVSFIGRPFPLQEAEIHFARLQNWGFNCLRLLTTWEAVEHAGPGQFDRAYIEYYGKLVELAQKYGLYVFVDFHQDVWSRFSGGDGAPGWLYEKIGIDLSKISDANAAIVMQHRYDFNDPRPRQEDKYPTMCWGQNYKYSANAIMWTLFFGGKDFAPDFKIDGINVQEFMQKHYLLSMLEIAKRVKNYPNVIGFDSLNEPNRGWIGTPMDDRHLWSSKKDPALPGIAWSPIDALYASNGKNFKIPWMGLSLLKGAFVPKKEVDANPKEVSIWLPNRTDPFLQAKAWQMTESGYEILNNQHFQTVGDRTVNFDQDYMFPFITKVAETIRTVNPDWLIFAEKDAKEVFYDPDFPENVTNGIVNSTHWYDNALNGQKKFMYPITMDVIDLKFVFGKQGIQAMYERQLNRIKSASAKINGGVPTLIGEFGIPFDLDHAKAYKLYAKGKRYPKIWKSQIMAMDLMMNVMDRLLLNSTQWNYTAHNRNDPRIGDCWNQEDLSIFSLDQLTSDADLYSGLRAGEGFIRPYVQFTQGIPQHMAFDRKTGIFRFLFDANAEIAAPTEIFVPQLQYPNGYHIIAEGCEITKKGNNQWVELKATQSGLLRVTIQRK